MASTRGTFRDDLQGHADARHIRHVPGSAFESCERALGSPTLRLGAFRLCHDRTVREIIRQLVDEIVPADPTESEHRLDVLRWLDSTAEIFRTAKPATPPKHLVSYCVLVDTTKRNVFLVNHRDAQRWLPTGGHVEVDEHPIDAATREILEELRVAPDFHPSVGPKPLMVTVTRTQGVSEPHTDVSLWFAFDGSREHVLAPDETEFVDARWWSFDDVPETEHSSFDPHLPRFISKLQACVA